MNPQSLSVSGPMTIYEATDWREQFQAAISPGKPLAVDLHTAGPWDVAGLQLLISLVRTGDQRDCPIRFRLVPSTCREIARRAGLLEWLLSHSDSEL
jgi:ABC-type transporter Mla MlaB component